MAKKKDDFVRICPKCNSTDISTDFSNPALNATGLFNNAYVCNNCGNTGNFFPEVERATLDPVKGKGRTEKRNLINASYRKNILWYWKFSAPLCFLIGIIFLILGDNVLFYIGLIELIPLSIVLSISVYRKDLMSRYPSLRLLSFFIYIYSFTIGPIIILFISS